MSLSSEPRNNEKNALKKKEAVIDCGMENSEGDLI